MVIIFAAGKRLATQIQNISHTMHCFYILKSYEKVGLHCLNTMGFRSKIEQLMFFQLLLHFFVEMESSSHR